MKRSMILILFFCIICASGCYIGDTDSQLVLNKEKSFFSDYSIEDGKVYYYCYLIIDNKSNNSCRASIVGDFLKDQDSGLLKERYLTAVEDKRNIKQSLFLLEPGENVLEIVFIGTNGKSIVRNDRLLPPITINKELEEIKPE
ncbi:MAG: hypothetical protein IJ744_03130 [Lachnospiraceae bacterium]|nr:hypothetical protein [Lachnospiraceae bacterium]